MERKGHPETILGVGGQAAQIRTSLSYPAPPSTIPKTPAARAPVLPAPRRRSPPLPRRPGPSSGRSAEARGLGAGAAIRGPALCARDLGQENVAPSSPWPRPGGGGRSSRGPNGPSWVPEMLSPGQGLLAGFPRSGARWASPLPSAPPKMRERAPPRANGEVLGPEQRMRPSESPRRGGPAPGRPRLQPGSGASPEVPGAARGRGGPLAAPAQAGSARLSVAPGRPCSATHSEMSRGEAKSRFRRLVSRGALTRGQRTWPRSDPGADHLPPLGF